MHVTLNIWEACFFAALILLFFTTSILLFIRLNRLLRQLIEWKIGKEAESISYISFFQLRRKYKKLGGKSEVFTNLVLDNFRRRLKSADAFSVVQNIFKGFHWGDEQIETLHDKIAKEEGNRKAVIESVEREWDLVTKGKTDLTEDKLSQFELKLDDHWCKAYRLSERFYHRIKTLRKLKGFGEG